MDTKRELKILVWIILIFTVVFFLPIGSERFQTAIDATLDLARGMPASMSSCACCRPSSSPA